MMMNKQKTLVAERLNLGSELREFKLGATFNPTLRAPTGIHTIKYDFKPASVDTNRMANVEVGSNNQVTVTVPNLESSGVPYTVYKGNHRKYTKECVIVYDKETGAITIEKLNHNIQVKKTRSEMANKPSLMPAAANAPPNGQSFVGNVAAPIATAGGKLENSTMRISSKTKVSTGSRRNNIIDFKPRNSPMQQSSPSLPVVTHRSPQSAPAWHANNNQQTLPSIPMIVDDDDFGFVAALHNGAQANTSGSSNNSLTGQQEYMPTTHTTTSKQRQAHGHNKRQQMAQRQSPSPNYGRGYNNGAGNNYAQQQQQQRHSPPGQQQQQQLQQHQQQQRGTFSQGNINSNSNSNSMPLGLDSPIHNDFASQSVAHAAAVLEQQIGGALSGSSSSSESDSSDSDSGSDSDDSTEDDRSTEQLPQQQLQQHHQLPNLGLGSISPAYNNHHQPQQQQQQHLQQQQHQQLQHPQHQQHSYHQQQQQQQQSGIYASNGGFPNDLLQNDLQLSSNSSDDDDD